MDSGNGVSPLASVVVPCWNVAKWLPRCLDEVCAALPENCEIVAVDDGSTDSTLAVLEESARRIPFLKVLRRAHGGVSAARNDALAVCRGEFLFFVDPDDGVAPGFFREMIAAMRREDADYCICAYATRGEDGSPGRTYPLRAPYRFRTREEIASSYLPRIFGYSMDDARLWNARRPIFARREMAFACRAAFRRDIVEKCAVRFDESLELNEDMLFNARYLLCCERMASVPDALYLVTERSDSAQRIVPRDGLRMCRNKLAMLRARNALDDMCGGRLAPLYAASCVFSALEIERLCVLGRVPRREGISILREYLRARRVSDALASFPISPRRPFAAAAVLVLRLLAFALK